MDRTGNAASRPKPRPPKRARARALEPHQSFRNAVSPARSGGGAVALAAADMRAAAVRAGMLPSARHCSYARLAGAACATDAPRRVTPDARHRGHAPPSSAVEFRMDTLLATVADVLIFVVLAWGIWRLLSRAIPIAVIPIVIGLVLAATGWLPAAAGVPSAPGNALGFIGVLLLAFSAGLETRQLDQAAPQRAPPPRSATSTRRLGLSAATALLLPFAVGTLVAYGYFAGLPDWSAPNGDRLLGALAIGLCIAVSALPVLIGIVRELGPLHRPLTQVALKIAVLDEAVLWSGLAVLLMVADGRALLADGSPWQLLALAVPVLMLAGAALAARRALVPPRWLLWLVLPGYLAAGAWASAQLGLHELLGAYFAGVLVPASWGRRLPVDRIGQLALLGLAPLFFGHSGLKIDGDALGWASLQAAGLLLVVSVLAKLAAVALCPPVAGFSRRDTLAVGALLQCKGLMEIVAATILRDKGLLSEHAFAALVTLAVLSTLLTGPAFRWIVRRGVAQRDPDRQPA
jgi:Kef-type K+ transport system membrane component KefB